MNINFISFSSIIRNDKIPIMNLLLFELNKIKGGIIYDFI